MSTAALIFVVQLGLASDPGSLAPGLLAQPPLPSAELPAERVPRDELPPEEWGPEELPAGRSMPGWLGVVLADGFAPHGVLIVDVAPRSPAAAAGLRPGDLIRRLGDVTPRDALDVATLVGNRQVGAPITLTILRGRVLIETTATLANAPPAHANPAVAPPQRPTDPLSVSPDASHGSDRARLAPPQAWLGVETAPVTNLARRLFHLPGNRGAVVSHVYAGSPAQRAGIRPGAVIRAIDSRQVTNPHDVARLVFEAGIGKRIEISLWADDVPVRLFVRLDVHPLDRPAVTP